MLEIVDLLWMLKSYSRVDTEMWRDKSRLSAMVFVKVNSQRKLQEGISGLKNVLVGGTARRKVPVGVQHTRYVARVSRGSVGCNTLVRGSVRHQSSNSRCGWVEFIRCLAD